MKKNPYSPTKPGNLFTGYEKLRLEILRGFVNGNSYALLGGRRCGKTSLIIQIEKDLKKYRSSTFNPIPLRLSIQRLGNITSAILLEWPVS